MAYPKSVAVILVAIAAAVLPLPPAWVERVYSRGVYPVFQPVATTLSNLVPVALLDIAVASLLAGLAVAAWRGWTRRGVRRSLPSAVRLLVTGGAAVYLLFLLTWGLNYRRVPLEARIAFDRGRVTTAAAGTFAALAISRVNAAYTAAHEQPFRPALLELSFGEAQVMLGSRRVATTGRPKRSFAGLYFRYAALDGMTVPVFLEIILNPDILPIERPSVLAHEWAHLAGFADESEANFVAWLAGIRSSDAVAHYSAWLDAYRLAAAALPRAARARLPPLDPGPREDLRDIAARYARSSPAVRSAARGVYDSYLKANRIEEGIANYGVALQLMLGTEFGEGWTPRLLHQEPAKSSFQRSSFALSATTKAQQQGNRHFP